MAVKPTGSDEYREVTYGSARWAKLKALREMAKPVMAALAASHLNSVVHGSMGVSDVIAMQQKALDGFYNRDTSLGFVK
jgi:predicted nucleotidyltransferase